MVHCSDELHTYIQLSIKIYLLDHLELCLNFILKTDLYHIKKMVESDVDVPKIKPSYIQPAVFLSLYL